MEEALRVLRAGGIILYPTDTVWGIGCDATNEQAVKRIYQLKQREDHKAMLCLLDSEAKLQGYVKDIPEMAYQLIELTNNPLTIIYDTAQNLAANIIAKDGSIGIRITEEVFSKSLCARLHKPIVSTSANISGEKTPQTFKDISERIKDGVDYVVKYRQTDELSHRSSSIIKLSKGNVIKVIR